ncbi:RNA polymerase sigma-I factor [Pontibacillus halophilus]|uniref:RNA polymerase sigma-I factor n=1 Tax=Pontibacillus halophilus TaxID=516704 RepID=UPI0003F9BD84|nr:RNA polymerase sigma-I factor [Pontibacillus halophilus]
MIRRLFHHKHKENNIEELIEAAQAGDEEIQNQLLSQYQPFIAKSVSEVCKRYIDSSKDDEFSIGLMAFHEAIQSYSKDKGSSFLSFAKLVVKRKVIDYIRYEQNHVVTASLDDEHDDEQLENPQEIQAAKDRFEKESQNWQRKTEIEDYNEKLQEFKLSFSELSEVAPKHRDARESAISVARVIYEDELLLQFVQTKKKLPIKDLSTKVSVSKKTLERNRKFILAIVILMSEDYVYLKEYVKGV